jgi:hypothetical protein
MKNNGDNRVTPHSILVLGEGEGWRWRFSRFSRALEAKENKSILPKLGIESRFLHRLTHIPVIILSYMVIVPLPVATRSAVARLLGLRVRIPPGAWKSLPCECCVLSGRVPCVGLITVPEESYRVWCVWVWLWSHDSEDALAHYGMLAIGGKKNTWLCFPSQLLGLIKCRFTCALQRVEWEKWRTFQSKLPVSSLAKRQRVHTKSRWLLPFRQNVISKTLHRLIFWI